MSSPASSAPTFWPAYFELYKLLKDREQWDQAALALEKTAELNPDYAPAHYALAEYYSRKGDRARAAHERELHHKLLADQRTASIGGQALMNLTLQVTW